MVTYQEQVERIAATNAFVSEADNISLNYRGLYDSCVHDSRCNLEIFVDEHGIDPNSLDASIINPIKYDTLRETLAHREILLDAGYKLNDFDSNNALINDNYTVTLNPNKQQPNQEQIKENLTTNYEGLTDSQRSIALQNSLQYFELHDNDSNTSVYQNDHNNFDPMKNSHNDEKISDSTFGINNDEIKKIGVGVGVAVVAGLVYMMVKKK